jgi:hypothetical protein
MFLIVSTTFTPALSAQAPTGQHWWMCRYKDVKDPARPAAGSLMYYALLPSSAPVPGDLNAHFNAYIQQSYKIVDKNNAGNGFCQRYSDNAAGRAFSMDMMVKQWASANMQTVQVPWTDTPGEDAAIDTRSAATAPAPAAPAGAPFIICATSGGAGIDTYLTGAFQTTRVRRMPSGGNLVDQAILNDFYAYLTQKGYKFKPGSNYGCAVKPTEAEAKADEQKRQSGCSTCGKVVETGWTE